MLLASEILIESINDGFIMVDSSWQITAMNRRARMMLRLLDTDPRNQGLWEVFPDDPTTPTRRELERAVQQHVTVEFDVFYPHLYVWHEVRAVPDQHGLGLLLRDITDRQWLLRREAERAYLRNLFNDAPVALSITRGPDHQFEFVNAFATQLLGGQHVEGQSYKEAFPEFEAQGFIDLLNHVYTSGVPYHAQEQLVRFDRQNTGTIEDAYFTFTYQPLRGFDSQVSGIMTLCVDMTAQVRARKESERLVAEQQAILSQLPDGVIVTDAEGRIIYVNDVASALHGVATLQVAPEEYASAYHLFTMDGEPYPIENLPLTRAVRDDATTVGAEWQIRQPSGTMITVEGSASPIYAANTKIGAVLTLRLKRNQVEVTP